MKLENNMFLIKMEIKLTFKMINLENTLLIIKEIKNILIMNKQKYFQINIKYSNALYYENKNLFK